MTINNDSMSTHHAVLISAPMPLVYTQSEFLEVPASDQYRLLQFGIEDVRRLINDAYRRPNGEAKQRILVVATEFITEEAQQALLKIIEEPPLSTRFFFVIPFGYTFLPTLESRFERVHAHEESRDTHVFLDFKTAPYSNRLSLIEQSVKDKNHAWQADIKYGLMSYLLKSRDILTVTQLKELEYVVRVLLTRGASNKFLLEHLALTLPA
jgi:DNA polymerase III, delta subunit